MEKLEKNRKNCFYARQCFSAGSTQRRQAEKLFELSRRIKLFGQQISIKIRLRLSGECREEGRDESRKLVLHKLLSFSFAAIPCPRSTTRVLMEFLKLELQLRSEKLMGFRSRKGFHFLREALYAARL